MKKTFPLATLYAVSSLFAHAADFSDDFRYLITPDRQPGIFWSDAQQDAVYEGDTLGMEYKDVPCTITASEILGGVSYWKASFSFDVAEGVEYTLSNIHLTFNPTLVKEDATDFKASYVVRVWNGDSLVSEIIGDKTFTVDKTSASYAFTLDKSTTGGENFNGSYQWVDSQDSMTGDFRMEVYFENVEDVSGYAVESGALVGRSRNIPEDPIPSNPAVPEPTTATLSLLALAGLAARRRCRA